MDFGLVSVFSFAREEQLYVSLVLSAEYCILFSVTALWQLRMVAFWAKTVRVIESI